MDAPHSGKKKAAPESDAQEAGLVASEATAELLESGGYAFRHFDLGLVWSGAPALRQVPLWLGVLTPLAALAVSPWMVTENAMHGFLLANSLTFPMLLGVAAVLTMVHVRDRLAGQEAASTLLGMLRGRLGLVAAAAGLHLVIWPLSSILHALVVALVGVPSQVGLLMAVGTLLGLGVSWVWLLVLSRLALLGESPTRALPLGLADAAVYGARALAELPFYPGLWWGRLQGSGDRRISAVDLVASLLLIRGLSAIGDGVVSLLLGGAVAWGGPVDSGAALVMVARAFVGVLALQVGLGRWSFYRLALAAERSEVAAVDAVGDEAGALPIQEGAS